MSTGPVLTFTEPARSWSEGLPIGNGRVGAICFGTTGGIRLQLNEGTAWSGSPASASRPPQPTVREATARLNAARAAVLADDPAAADRELRGLQHRHSQAFVPVAELILRLPGAAAARGTRSFRRSLDLRRALHRCSDGAFDTIAYASAPDDVLVIEVTAPTRIPSIEVELGSGHPPVLVERAATAWTLAVELPSDVAPPHDADRPGVVYGDGPALHAVVVARWLPDAEGGLLLVAVGTDFVGAATMPHGDHSRVRAGLDARLDAACRRGRAELRARHELDHSSLFDRVALDLGGGHEIDLLATFEALAVPGGPRDPDPALVAIQFAYGRYLLIACSRRGGSAPTLQGIWNPHPRPPWSCNHTLNINLPMLAWPTTTTALPECAEPFLGLLEAVAEAGARTARMMYDAPGWVAHHNTDLWAYTLPVGFGLHDPAWSFWPLGGVWLALAATDTVEFGAGADIAERAWGPLLGCLEFVLSWLVELPDGRLGTVPSTSPENHYRAPDGSSVAAGISSTLDLALTRALLRRVLLLARRLRRADPLLARAREVLDRLPPAPIAPDGRIAEWQDDPPEVEPGHRHLSHLFDAFPGTQALDDEELAAVAASLDARGDEGSGWSLAWKLALRARLRDAGRVDELLRLYFRPVRTEEVSAVGGGVYPNLLAAHPPFQLDANLGYVAAIAECLLQSHHGSIDVLPCLPSSFRDGSVDGLVARPGVAVGIRWAAGTVRSVRLRALVPDAVGEHRVVLPDGTVVPVQVELDAETEVLG